MGHPDAHVPSLLLAGSGLVLISAGVICVWRPWVAALCDPLMSPPNCVTRDYEETSRQRAPGQCLTGEWLGDVPCVWRKIQGLGITSDGKLGSAWPMIPYLSWVWTGAPVPSKWLHVKWEGVSLCHHPVLGWLVWLQAGHKQLLLWLQLVACSRQVLWGASLYRQMVCGENASASTQSDHSLLVQARMQHGSHVDTPVWSSSYVGSQV